MIYFRTLNDLWRLLDLRGRLAALVLVMLLAISGVLEIAGMVFLFGYLSALSGQGSDVRLSGIVNFYDFIAGGLDSLDYAIVAGLVLIAVFVVKNALWLLSSFGLLRFAMKRYQQVAAALFDGYQEMPLEFMRQRGTLEPVQVLTSALQVFRSAFSPALQAGADIAIVMAMLAALMIAVDPVLVVSSGFVLGIVAIVFLAMSRQLSLALGKRSRKAQSSLSVVTSEALRGIVDVRISGRQAIMARRFDAVAQEFALADRRARALDMIPRALNELVLAFGIVLAAAWFATSEGGLAAALPTLAILGFAGLRVTAAMSRLTLAMQQMRQQTEVRENMMDAIARAAPQLLSGEAEAPNRRETYRVEDLPLPPDAAESLQREIAVSEVTFAYPDSDKPVLEGVSLTIPAGSFAAFCGPSGGGKSTLALLIMGLLKPQAGQVTCDGWDAHRHVTAWHRQIGYVGQTPFIAPRSVRENVAFGLPLEEIDDEAVWRALETAAVADLFRDNPKGLDFSLGEDGGLLSGGQRQRLAIARALYRDPAVLVFDEATAALDSVTEREVSKAIVALRGDRTLIAIAHRLTTIEGADVVHLVEAGRITASGSYSELLATNEAFRTLAGE